MRMEAFESLSNGDEDVPNVIFLKRLTVFYFLIDFMQQVAIIGKLHYGALVNRWSTRETCFINQKRPPCSRWCVYFKLKLEFWFRLMHFISTSGTGWTASLSLRRTPCCLLSVKPCRLLNRRLIPACLIFGNLLTKAFLNECIVF